MVFLSVDCFFFQKITFAKIKNIFHDHCQSVSWFLSVLIWLQTACTKFIGKRQKSPLSRREIKLVLVRKLDKLESIQFSALC